MKQGFVAVLWICVADIHLQAPRQFALGIQLNEIEVSHLRIFTLAVLLQGLQDWTTKAALGPALPKISAIGHSADSYLWLSV